MGAHDFTRDGADPHPPVLPLSSGSVHLKIQGTPRIRQANPGASNDRCLPGLEAAFRRVVASGNYILGEEVAAFEREFAAFLGAGRAVGVASGTDAIECALRAVGVGSGDLVVTVSHSAVATAAAIRRAGATPRFVDVDERTLTMDPARLEEALVRSAAQGRPARAIVPVHIYGCPADMRAINELGRRHGCVVIEDCAQAQGAAIDGMKVGLWGDLAAFSFFPTKNLGGLGDGGMVVTASEELDERLRAVRQYGWDSSRVSRIDGVNSRLDELQAAFLRVKLAELKDENDRRRELADTYHSLLGGLHIDLPVEPGGSHHVYHQFVIRTPLRDRLRAWLLDKGIETGIHYPRPIHLQPAFGDPSESTGDLGVTERAANQVVSLPIFPQLDVQSVQRVAEAIREWHALGSP